MEDRNAVIKGPYLQRSIRARIEAFFLDNLGKVATREQLLEVATDPNTGRQPENCINGCPNCVPTEVTRYFHGAIAAT